jgi:hypothetical protein
MPADKNPKDHADEAADDAGQVAPDWIAVMATE